MSDRLTYQEFEIFTQVWVSKKKGTDKRNERDHHLVCNSTSSSTGIGVVRLNSRIIDSTDSKRSALLQFNPSLTNNNRILHGLPS